MPGPGSSLTSVTRVTNAALGFLLCAAFVPGWSDPSEAPKWMMLSVLAPLSFALSIADGKVPGEGWLLAFLAYSGLSSLWSIVSNETINETWHLTLIAFGFAIGTRDKENVDALWNGAAAGMGFSSIAVIAQVFGWTGVPQAGDALPAGLFVNSNILSWTAAIVFSVMVGRRNVIGAALVAPCFLCWIILPYQGHAILNIGNITSAVAVAAALIVFCTSALGRMSVGVIAAMIAIAIIAFGVSGSAVKLPHLLDRVEFIRQTVAHLSWFGWGGGTWFAEYPLISSLPLTEGRPEHAHSDVVELVAEYGLGLLLLAPVAIRTARACLLNTDTDSRVLAGRMGLTAFVVCALAGFPSFEPATSFLAACCAGRLCMEWRPVCAGARHFPGRNFIWEIH